MRKIIFGNGNRAALGAQNHAVIMSIRQTGLLYIVGAMGYLFSFIKKFP